MDWLAMIRRRMGSLFLRHDEDELDEEIRLHLEMEIAELVRQGLSKREARRRALAVFGRVENVKDDVRDVRRFARLLADATQDARVGMRSLLKRPGFASAVILTLGLGIGGNVAMLGVLDVSLFRALPYPEPESLVLGRVTYEGEVGGTVSGPDFFDYRDEVRGLASLDAFTPFPVEVTVAGSGQPERVLAPLASEGFFETVGVRPIVGRTFLPEEGEPGGAAVVDLTHEYWQRRFGGDRQAVGGSLTVDGTPHTVVGVLEPGFRLMVDADVWRPIHRGEGWAEARQFHNFLTIGRLTDGATLASTQAEIDVVSTRLANAYPDTNRDKGLRLTPLREALNEGYESQLALLSAAVALLLLVACANVAGLLVVRGGSRSSEMAVRSVMGAGSGRLARQLLTENGLLAVGATLVGVAVAAWLQRGILAFLEMSVAGPELAGLSPTMWGGALLLALATLGLFGLAPALRVARSEPAADLRSGRRTTGARHGARLQSSTVVFQVAMTSVLLVVSGLLLRSFNELRAVDPGFDPDGVLTAQVPLPSGDYQDVRRRAAFFTQLRERLAALPGVEAAAIINRLPVIDDGGNVRVARPETWGDGGIFDRIAYQRNVLPGYFETMGIPLLAGRDFTSTDDRDALPVMIISDTLAAELFPDESPLGKTLGVDVGTSEPWTAEVVGVVGDVIPSSLADGHDYAMYFSYPQRASATVRLALRAAVPQPALVSGIREVVSSLDPNVPVADVVMMRDALDASVANRRSLMTVLIVFAGVAVLLAAVGLYGLMAYHVSRRVHEIGVRMALGASVRDVAGGVLKQGMTLSAAGLLLAIPLSLLAGRWVRQMLYQVDSTDPLTYLGVAVFLVGVTTVACLVPSRRAAQIDPAEAFRAD